jgi:hypothetical protein
MRPYSKTLGTQAPINTPPTVPLRGWINRVIATSSQNLVYVAFTLPLDQLAQESKFQHLAPTICATNKNTRDGTQESSLEGPIH